MTFRTSILQVCFELTVQQMQDIGTVGKACKTSILQTCFEFKVQKNRYLSMHNCKKVNIKTCELDESFFSNDYLVVGVRSR